MTSFGNPTAKTRMTVYPHVRNNGDRSEFDPTVVPALTFEFVDAYAVSKSQAMLT